MRAPRPVLAVLFAVTFAFGSGARRYETIASVRFQWSAADPPFAFILEREKKDAAQELRFAPARLRVVRNGHTAGIFPLRYGVANFREELHGTGSSPRNLVQSSFFLFTSLDERPPFLFLWGPGDGTGPGAFYAFSLDPEGIPRKALEEEQFEFWEFKDVDGDAKREILGRQTDAEAVGYDGESYDPFWILKPRQDPPGAISYDRLLSERYNRKHYVWVGPRYDARVVVEGRRAGHFKVRRATTP